MSAEPLPDPLAAAAALTGPGVTPPSLSGAGRRFISDIVVELGFVSAEAAEQAVEAGRRPGTTPEKVLLDSGALTEDELARALAERYGLEHIDLAEFPVDGSAAGVLREAAARRYQAAPVGFTSDGTLILAVADPADSLGLSDIAVMTKLPVRPAVASRSQLEALLDELQFMEDPVPTGPQTIGTVIVPPDDDDAPDDSTQTLRIAPPAATPDADGARLAQLERELEAGREELAALREKLAAERTRRVEELDAERARTGAALDAERERHQRELEALRTRGEQALEDARAASDISAPTEDDLRAELEHTRAELEGTRAELERTRSALGDVRATLEDTRATLEDTRAELEPLEDADRRAEDARAALAELREESERQAELHSLIEREQKAELARAHDENHRLGVELGNLQEKIADATKAFEAMGSAERRLTEIAQGLSKAPAVDPADGARTPPAEAS